jgi:hypothetical protein
MWCIQMVRRWRIIISCRVTNHYARLVHEANLEGRRYAFPYDVPAAGQVDQSGFVNGKQKAFSVSIG